MHRIAISAVLCLPIFVLAQSQSDLNCEWRGQAEYLVTLPGGATDSAAHIVTNLTIKIEPGGKVTGASSENGCRMLGVASPGGAPTVLSLALTLTQCQHADLNRRYTGTLGHYQRDKYAALNLMSLRTTPGKVATFSVRATMRR